MPIVSSLSGRTASLIAFSIASSRESAVKTRSAPKIRDAIFSSSAKLSERGDELMLTIIESITNTDELIIALSNPEIHHILWFSASWCAPCKQVGEHLIKICNSNELKNKPLSIYKIDYENFNMDDIGITDDFKIKVLSEITKLPTMLHFKDSVEQIGKRINGADYELIEKFLLSIDEEDNLLSELDDF